MRAATACGVARWTPRDRWARTLPTGSTSPWRTATASAISWAPAARDRKSTRLNSSHQIISYAVFCLKKKKQPQQQSQEAVRHRAIDTAVRSRWWILVQDIV